MHRYIRRSLLIALLSASDVGVITAGQATVPGCVNGVLADPGRYFYAEIGRRPGTPATDWPQVITAFADRGVGKNLVAGEPIPADAPFYGLRLMFGGGNNPRGRVWVPTDQPIDGVWYGEEHQFIADNPTWAVPCWQDTRACLWADWTAGAAYAPRPCGGPVVVPPQPPPPVTPPTGELAALAARLAALEERHDSLRNDFDAFKVPPHVPVEDVLKALEALRFECVVARAGPGFLAHGHGCTVTARKP